MQATVETTKKSVQCDARRKSSRTRRTTEYLWRDYEKEWWCTSPESDNERTLYEEKKEKACAQTKSEIDVDMTLEDFCEAALAETTVPQAMPWSDTACWQAAPFAMEDDDNDNDDDDDDNDKSAWTLGNEYLDALAREMTNEQLGCYEQM